MPTTAWLLALAASATPQWGSPTGTDPDVRIDVAGDDLGDLVAAITDQAGWPISIETAPARAGDPDRYTASFTTLRLPPSADDLVCARTVLVELVRQLDAHPLAPARYHLLGGPGGFLMLPREVHTAAGWEPITPRSDVRITLPAAGYDRWESFFDAWLAACDAALSEPIYFWGDGDLSGPATIRLAAAEGAARDLLVEALAQSDKGLVWTLGSNPYGSGLTIRRGCGEWNHWRCSPGPMNDARKAAYERRRRPSQSVRVLGEDQEWLRPDDPDTTFHVTWLDGRTETFAPPEPTCPPPNVVVSVGY